jgi:hypothetical protein
MQRLHFSRRFCISPDMMLLNVLFQCAIGSGLAGIGDKMDDGRFGVSLQLPEF